jgi:hypothetical protein
MSRPGNNCPDSAGEMHVGKSWASDNTPLHVVILASGMLTDRS